MVIYILGLVFGKNVNGKYFNQIMVSYIGGNSSEKKCDIHHIR